MKTIRVLIVDDHALVRQGLRVFMESEGDIEVVGEATNGFEAVQHIEQLRPDVVLMDLVMPQMDGISAIRQIRQIYPGCSILVLTSFGEDARVYQSIKAGAIGLLLKDTPAEDLGQAIRSAAKGECSIDTSIARSLLDEFTETASAPATTISLTAAEMTAITILDQGYRQEELVERMNTDRETVQALINAILHKLHQLNHLQTQ